MNSSIVQLLAFEKLNGDNYAAWKSNLNTILVVDDLRFVLTEECPQTPASNANQTSPKAYDRWIKANEKACVYILASMSDVLAKKYESLTTAKEIMDSLKGMFGQPKWSLRHETIKYIYIKRMKEGTSVREHVLDMMIHFNIAEVNGGAIDEAMRIGRLVKNGLLSQFEDNSLLPCDSCLEGKMTKRSFTRKGLKAKTSLELVHLDFCGPMNVKARGEYEYFISFIDDYSRYGHVYLIQNKSNSFEKFKEYKAEVENESGKTIKTLRSDRGGEYPRLLDRHGIQSQLCAPSTPQQNGVSERRNRTLLDMVRSMMSFAQLPDSFWGYALEIAIYILNNVPSKSVSETPYEIWKGRKGHLTDIKKWLATQFQMKDLGNAQYGIHLSKEQYSKTSQEVEDMSNIPYASAVGSLVYAMLCTRPDICYSVGKKVYIGISFHSEWRSGSVEKHKTILYCQLQYGS
ncbi:gag/pol protein [Cucumis melo var. makuwa]|uniref:Gag/pol protein n=1 Tax=Cucumis melo var. makuwa TaxID=1194695 RepID=A0A5A7UYF5_CUCMM|nr:gag/pol protein [Cucumis melo var. makuwa]TYK26116.1 gag/pol protein [Cucumis melo var. makuwa]